MSIKTKIYNLLRWSERYTKTDMVYLAKGGSWLFAGNIISVILSFVLALAFANLLPKETYGTYKYIIALLGILSIPSLKKIATSLSQAVARGFEGNYLETVKIKIKWGLIGSLASLLFSAYYFFQGNSTLGYAMLVISIFIPFYNSFYLYLSYLGAKKLFNKFTQYNIATRVVTTTIMVATIFFTQNIIIIIFSFIVSETLTRFYFLKKSFKKFPPNKEKDPSAISYGKHLSLMEVINVIAEQADKILLFHYIGASELAVYSIATTPVDQIRSLILNIRDLAFPKLSKESGEIIKQTLPNKILKASLIILPLIAIYVLIAPWFFATFFPEYLESIKLSQILSLILILTPLTLLSSSLSAKKQIKSLYKISFWGSLGRLIIYFMCIKLYGLLGLIFGRIIIDLYLAILYKHYFSKMKIT